MICDSTNDGFAGEGLRTCGGFGLECWRHGQKVAGCGAQRNARSWRTENASALEWRQRLPISASRSRKLLAPPPGRGNLGKPDSGGSALLHPRLPSFRASGTLGARWRSLTWLAHALLIPHTSRFKNHKSSIPQTGNQNAPTTPLTFPCRDLPDAACLSRSERQYQRHRLEGHRGQSHRRS